MNLKELIRDERTSIRQDGIDGAAYGRGLRHLRGYNFFDGAEDTPRLWEHQQAAIATVLAYLIGDKVIPERPEQTEAALLKLPTGTGKSGIVAVLARCPPDVRRVLVLTPRTALTEQLMADIRYRFWRHMGFEHEGTALFTSEPEDFGRALENVYVEQFLPKNVDMMVQHLAEPHSDRAIPTKSWRRKFFQRHRQPTNIGDQTVSSRLVVPASMKRIARRGSCLNAAIHPNCSIW